MGTSGAWGGSQTERWRQARDLLDQLQDPGSPGPSDPTLRPDTDPATDPPPGADALLDAIAAGLAADDPGAADPGGRPLPSLGALLGPRRPGGSTGGSTGGGGGRGGGGG